MTKQKISKREFEDRLEAIASADTLCLNCDFWWVRGRSSGWCRYGAPILVEEKDHRAVWPVTDPYDGCGDFECNCIDLDMLDLDDEERAELLGEDRDMGIIVEELRESLVKWKASHPEEFVEAIGEINQGNVADSYFLVRTLAVTKIPDFDRIPKAVVVDEILRLNQKIKFVIHRHEEPTEGNCCCSGPGENDSDCCK